MNNSNVVSDGSSVNGTVGNDPRASRVSSTTVAALGIVTLLASGAVEAATITWQNAGSDFNTGTNWSSNPSLPGTADAATFGTAMVVNPNLSSNISVGQLVFTTAAATGYNLTSSNTSTKLTLTSIGTGTGATGAGPAINVVSAVTNTISAPIELGAAAGSTQTFRSATAGGNTTISGVISEANAGINLSFATDGLWTLTNANTYTGTTTLSNGGVRLTVSNNQALGTTAGGTAVVSGAALQLQNNITIAGEALSLNGTGISNGGALRNLSGNNTYAGAITTTGSTRINSDSGTLLLDVASGNAITGTNDNLTFGGAGNVTVADVIATGTGTLIKDGNGTLTLSAANTFSGKTTITAGTLSINSIGNVSGGASALGTPTTIANGTIDIGPGATLVYTGTGHATNRVVNLLAGTAGVTLDASGSGALVFNSNVTSGNNSKTLTLTGSSTAANKIGGAISNNSLTELTSVNKTGLGTWVLSGNNTYTGTTTVGQGELYIDTGGSLAVGSAVSVAAGATLGGSGTINSSTTISGILAPGMSGIGTMTVNNSLTWNAGNAWHFELGSSAASMASAAAGGSTEDLLSLTGNFSKGTGSDWAFDFLGTAAVGWYQIVDWSGSTAFVDTDFGAPVNLGSGLSGTYVIDSGTSALYLQVVPEPSVVGLSALAALGLLRRRRAVR